VTPFDMWMHRHLAFDMKMHNSKRPFNAISSRELRIPQCPILRAFILSRVASSLPLCARYASEEKSGCYQENDGSTDLYFVDHGVRPPIKHSTPCGSGDIAALGRAR
jgi:hypothetical protein